ncbi:unnamed protein product, partial [Didymodactylos carnosus]
MVLPLPHLYFHRFIGEESDGEKQKGMLSNDPTWIIDPI